MLLLLRRDSRPPVWHLKSQFSLAPMTGVVLPGVAPDRPLPGSFGDPINNLFVFPGTGPASIPSTSPSRLCVATSPSNVKCALLQTQGHMNLASPKCALHLRIAGRSRLPSRHLHHLYILCQGVLPLPGAHQNPPIL